MYLDEKNRNVIFYLVKGLRDNAHMRLASELEDVRKRFYRRHKFHSKQPYLTTKFSRLSVCMLSANSECATTILAEIRAIPIING
jgi:hypothetical protein